MTEWFKDWFASDEYLSVYSHRNSQDAAQLLKLIFSNILLPPKEPRKIKVLDSACGCGRHASLLARMDFSVFGFDLSKQLLEIASNQNKKENLHINYLRADLRKIPFSTKFDLILSLFTSFGYFKTDSENFAIVKFASDNIHPKGYFVLDYLNPDFVKNNLVAKSERIIGSKTIIEKREITNNRVEKEITIIGGNFSNRYFESVRLYSDKEILSFFKLFGFSPVHKYGNYSGAKFLEDSSERMIIIFKKN